VQVRKNWGYVGWKLEVARYRQMAKTGFSTKITTFGYQLQKAPAMKKLAIGVDDFKKLREYDAYFVDKSLLIEEIIEEPKDVLLFPRPRRFGKTLNMSMMHYFFTNENPEENHKLFDGLAITQRPAWEQHQGKYPVISLSFKSCKGDSYNEIYDALLSIIVNAFKKHAHILEKDLFDDLEIDEYLQVQNKKANKALVASSLLLLSSYLHRYYQQKVIILIDEYDTPIHEAYLNGFYKKAVDFMRILLGNALKGNAGLQKGILTGILRVSKESMFSDLNNVNVYSVLSKKFNTHFGFTQPEVDQMLLDFDMDAFNAQVKEWYNGYYFGNLDVYNPWSLLNFVDSGGRFQPYWLGTSANELVHTLIRDSDKAVKKDIEDALNDVPVYSAIPENISFQHLQTNREIILSFFVQTGYLKARYQEMQKSRLIYELSIPNEELKLIYIDTVNIWFDEHIGSNQLDEMLHALISGNISTFERIFSKLVLETLSYFNVGRKTKEVERVFQAFLLGMLIRLKGRYEVYSEKESGYGRFDVSVIPNDKSQQAIIMELKSIDTFNNETKDQALDAALKQIEDRNYEAALRQQGCTNIMKVAVTFDGKRVWARISEK
jgi:hypothetical protein